MHGGLGQEAQGKGKVRGEINIALGVGYSQGLIILGKQFYNPQGFKVI